MFNIKTVHIKNMRTIRPCYFLSDPKTWRPSRDPWHTAQPHSGGIRSSTGLTTAKLKWQTQQTLPFGRKIYLQPLLAWPHSPGQPGFHISQEQIGWNSQHHSTLVNEGRMASSSSSSSLHGRGRWLTAVLYWWRTHLLCVTLVRKHWRTGTWPKPHTPIRNTQQSAQSRYATSTHDHKHHIQEM